MPNRSTGHCPFSIVYTKMPNHLLDLAVLPKCHSSSATKEASQCVELLKDVKAKLETSYDIYKQHADKHRRLQVFQPGDLVMLRFRKDRFPSGSHSKLNPRKIRPFPILRRINDNVYVVDLPLDFKTSSTFNVTDIFPYHPPDDTVVASSSLEASSFEAGET
ncbi:hypothetical protein KFK09_020260 [Dendrobium nobile]|uniref:Tf2-1-like SH3-like domain-containing protein n=1 Tax=Dendrobium nobile TaxID=94219 RepID=A0A8T3ATB4_DENNO|nr:hypothetical protein KFK09_020260 [Dendrobium nobile]